MGESKLGIAVVPVRADLSELDKDFAQAKDKAEKAGSGIADSLTKASKGMKDVGGKLTAGVTLPLVGAGLAATKFANDFNAEMANVATMIPGNTERVNELKGSVQDMAIAVGKDTSDLAGGLYQVVSAFGDTAETTKILDINARAAAAGLATTTDAINLTSAVTKGYGDTSAEAVQKVSDLAFQTVKLGQTTFPELASSMGKVVPIASALGVSEEELFAQMATLTGVTGNAAEVSTQLRATFQALLNPTEDMAGAIATVAGELDAQGKLAGGPLVDQWRANKQAVAEAGAEYGKLVFELANTDTKTKAGAARAKELNAAIKEQDALLKELAKSESASAAALGQTVVQSVGVTDALSLLSAEAGGNTAVLSKMFGSVESLNAVLALGGPQADAFKEKLKAMGGVAGTTTEAFKEQTEGINKNGFALQQAQAKAEVTAQKLGDALAPALSKAIDAGRPLLDLLVAGADAFAKLDPNLQTVIVGVLALVAAVGPLLLGLGMILPAIGAVLPLLATVGGAIAAVATGPIALIVGAIALLTLAWTQNWGDIQGRVKSAMDFLGDVFEAGKAVFGAIWGAIYEQIRWRVNLILSLVNALIGAWNRLEFRIPGFNVPIPSVDIPGIGRVGGGNLGWGGLNVSTPDLPTIPLLGEGGIVTRPTLAVVGDVPEAVVPLSQLGLGGGVTVNFTAPLIGRAEISEKVDLEAVLDRVSQYMEHDLGAAIGQWARAPVGHTARM